MTTALTAPETHRRATLEDIVERTSDAAGQHIQALIELRDSKLYRSTHGTWEEYLNERWGRTRQWFSIEEKKREAAPVLSTMVDKVTNRQAKAITAVPVEKRAEVVKEAAKIDPKVTPKAIEQAAAKVTPPPPPMTKVKGEEALAKHSTQLFTDIIGLLRDAQGRTEYLSKQPTGRELRLQRIQGDIENAIEAIRFAIPHALCPCRGDAKCKVCKGDGWVNREQATRLKEAKR